MADVPQKAAPVDFVFTVDGHRTHALLQIGGGR